MSYTWTTGEVITADKLNATSGIQYDLELVLFHEESTGDNGLTGHGLSPEELLTKLNNGEIITASLVVLPDEYRTPRTLVCLESGRDENNNLYFNCGSSIAIDVRAIGTDYCDFVINASYIFTYTYNSSTKEYTFTYDGSAG